VVLLSNLSTTRGRNRFDRGLFVLEKTKRLTIGIVGGEAASAGAAQER